MAECLFYHLTAVPLERALPDLLERCVQRRWRTVVEMAAERIEAMDSLLWTYSDDGFLPHGIAGERLAVDQPVLLTAERDNPNTASVRFLLDGVALPENTADYQRIVVMFDGNDEEAVGVARQRWREAKDAGLEATYWQADESGQWRQRG